MPGVRGPSTDLGGCQGNVPRPSFELGGGPGNVPCRSFEPGGGPGNVPRSSFELGGGPGNVPGPSFELGGGAGNIPCPSFELGGGAGNVPCPIFELTEAPGNVPCPVFELTEAPGNAGGPFSGVGGGWREVSGGCGGGERLKFEVRVGFQPDGAVVGAEDVGEDVAVFEVGLEAGGGGPVVDAPSDVPGAGIAAVAPPGVALGCGIEGAEDVEESGFQQGGEASAFLVGEAGVEAVGAGVGEVDFLMGDVEIAAEEDGFFGGEGEEVVAEMGVPTLAVGEAGEFALAVGGVAVDEEEIGVLGGLDAAFPIVLGEIHAGGDGEGRDLGEDHGAAVAFFLGGIEEDLVVGEGGEVDLFGQDFGFLKAEDIGLAGADEIGEAFIHGGAEAVDVPGD